MQPACSAAENAFGPVIEIAIKPPAATVLAGDVFLEHGIGLHGIFKAVVKLQQLACRSHNESGRARFDSQKRAIDALQRHRELRAFAKLQYLLARAGESGFW